MSDIDDLASEFSRIYLRLYRLLDQRMAAKGASLARTKLLYYLQKHGPSRATDIADLFGTAPRTVTEAIDLLERDGLVTRTPHPTDRRAKLVALTPAGERIIAATEPLRQRLGESVFGVLAAEDRRHLAAILAQLSDAIDTAETVA